MAPYLLKENICCIIETNYFLLFKFQTLKGNKDRNSEVKHILNGGVLARYLCFLPETYYGGVCLRTEVFGVKQKPGDYVLYY